MTRYYTVTIKNIKTGQEELFSASLEKNGSFDFKYSKIFFTTIINAAKGYISEKEDRFSWIIASVKDVTRY